MKSTTHTADSSVLLAQTRRIGADALILLGHLATRFGKGAKSAVLKIQIARMESVLRNLSDSQLADIDLERRDIPDRARSLLGYQYDGL